MSTTNFMQLTYEQAVAEYREGRATNEQWEQFRTAWNNDRTKFTRIVGTSLLVRKEDEQ